MVLRSELDMITVGLSLTAIRTVATQERTFYTEATEVLRMTVMIYLLTLIFHAIPLTVCQPNQMLYLVKFITTSVPLNFLVI